ncbi:hypothetical protein Fmac_023473 [Flemingia macrophylla]|uniref:Uncharacterized protein n=1 Tax=Flemingia macrophylla TaxID=520843 RepID=A0ABD1LLL9_9FABA
MANKMVALLLLVCLVVAVAAVDGADDDGFQSSAECYDYCYGNCPYPAVFCKWWCKVACEHPIDSMAVSRPGAAIGRKYPVPTEQDYLHRASGL